MKQILLIALFFYFSIISTLAQSNVINIDSTTILLDTTGLDLHYSRIECAIIDSILNNKKIKYIISLNDTSVFASIRIHDMSDHFVNTCNYFVIDGEKTMIRVKKPKFPLDFNTGRYREIVITKCDISAKKYQVELFVYSYVCSNQNHKLAWMFNFYFYEDDSEIIRVEKILRGIGSIGN
jgi:hypothetical protein